SLFFLSRSLAPPRYTLFPYTTLFRSAVTSGFAVVSAQIMRIPATTYAQPGTMVFGMRASRERRRTPPARQIKPFASSADFIDPRSEEHTFELQSPYDLVCRLLLEKKK